MALAELACIKVGEGNPVLVVGAINLSPESFYLGSFVKGPSQALRVAERMLDEGAGIIDVGAMSTAPGVKPISQELERRRLIPVIKALAKGVDAPISADTQRAAVAKEALEAGASVVNDVSGLKADPAMAEVLVDSGCSVVLMAAKRKPGDARDVREVNRVLRESLRICKRRGVDLRKVVVDPGIGFGKPVRCDLGILANLGELKKLGRPVCVAVSRKRFIGAVLGLPSPADRLWGSLAATAIAVLNGADVIRTHDPKQTLQAVRVAEAIREATR